MAALQLHRCRSLKARTEEVSVNKIRTSIFFVIVSNNYVSLLFIYVFVIFFLRMPPKKLKAIQKARGRRLYQKYLEVRRSDDSEERPEEVDEASVTPTREAILGAEGKSTLHIRKQLLLGSDHEEYLEGERLLSLKEERLRKLVQCIGKCDSCHGQVVLKTRSEQFEVFLEVTCKECEKI